MELTARVERAVLASEAKYSIRECERGALARNRTASLTFVASSLASTSEGKKQVRRARVHPTLTQRHAGVSIPSFHIDGVA